MQAKIPAVDGTDPPSLTTDQGQLCELPMSSDDLISTEQQQEGHPSEFMHYSHACSDHCDPGPLELYM